MGDLSKPIAALFVDRSGKRWVVRDPDGKFWVLHATDDAWVQREPLDPTPELDLEPVPGHYKDMFRLPF